MSVALPPSEAVPFRFVDDFWWARLPVFIDFDQKFKAKSAGSGIAKGEYVTPNFGRSHLTNFDSLFVANLTLTTPDSGFNLKTDMQVKGSR